LVKILKSRWKKKKWTQKEFAALVGITQASLNRILNGKHSPTTKNLDKISNILGVSSKALTAEPAAAALAHGNSVSFDTYTAMAQRAGVLQHQLDEAKKELELSKISNQADDDLATEYFEYYASKLIRYQIEQLRDQNEHQKLNWRAIFNLLNINYDETVLAWKRLNREANRK